MDKQALEQAVFLLGPWLIGCSLDFFFQGIICCQFAHYISARYEDKTSLRMAIAGLALLTTLKSIQSFALIWIQLILNFTDLDGAILLNYTTWWQSGNALMVATIGAYVQVFFCYRLFIISKKKWGVLLPIALVLVFAYLSIVLATFYISKADGPRIGMWFAAHLSSVFAGDLFMSSATAYFLLKTKKEVLPQTVGLISALVRLTFQTAAPAALCAMFNLMFSQMYPGEEKIVSTAFNQALPKLYAMSMMWTLNARGGMRAIHRDRGYSSSGADDRARTTRNRDNVELAAYNGVQVHTHTETTHNIDVRDMFKRPVTDVKPRVDESDEDSLSMRKLNAV